MGGSGKGVRKEGRDPPFCFWLCDELGRNDGYCVKQHDQLANPELNAQRDAEHRKLQMAVVGSAAAEKGLAQSGRILKPVKRAATVLYWCV